MNLTYLFAGWECHCSLFRIYCRFCTFGCLVCCKQAEVLLVLAVSNRYVSFAFVFFAYLKLVDTIVWTHVGH